VFAIRAFPDHGLRLDKTAGSLENAGFSNENRQPQ
jgi:hypothetical protein